MLDCGAVWRLKTIIRGLPRTLAAQSPASSINLDFLAEGFLSHLWDGSYWTLDDRSIIHAMLPFPG